MFFSTCRCNKITYVLHHFHSSKLFQGPVIPMFDGRALSNPERTTTPIGSIGIICLPTLILKKSKNSCRARDRAGFYPSHNPKTARVLGKTSWVIKRLTFSGGNISQTPPIPLNKLPTIRFAIFRVCQKTFFRNPFKNPHDPKKNLGMLLGPLWDTPTEVPKYIFFAKKNTWRIGSMASVYSVYWDPNSWNFIFFAYEQYVNGVSWFP